MTLTPSNSNRRALAHRRVLAKRRGLTLVEMLIAITITLIVLIAMTLAFKSASREISRGRAVMEMAAQLRSAGETLRSDLAGLTVSARPWSITAESNGYFEIVEGAARDDDNVGTIDSYLGDWDDIIAMTVRSKGRPFRGRYSGGIAESYVAEIIWFPVHQDQNGNGTVEYGESFEGIGTGNDTDDQSRQ